MQRRVVCGRLALVVAVLWFGSLAVARADDGFPYTAYVTTDDVYVRSGPGKNYYPTMKLPRGATVEVYRHDPGGWYAIRPPEGCFSWVSGKYVEPGDDGIGIITGDRVVARVGSQFSDIRDVIQVRLYEGEEVELLGQKQFGQGPSAQIWYRIAPPAGEFRWVYGKYIDPEPPTYAHARPESRQNLIISRIERENEPAAEDAQEETTTADLPSTREPNGRFADDRRADDAPTADAATRAAMNVDVADGGRPIAATGDGSSVQRASATALLSDNSVEEESSGRDAASPRSTAATAGSLAHRSRRESPRTTAPARRAGNPTAAARPTRRGAGESAGTIEDDFDARLDALNLELSTMVSEEPTTWSFESLKARTRSLLNEAETAVERGKVRLLLGRIERFEQIAQRYRSVARLAAQTDAVDRQLAGVSRLQRAGVRRLQPAPRYDGMGRLARVASQEYGAPQYALLDENGHVRYYVTPAPGVNLQYYLGRWVGVTGNRSPRSELPAQHLTAKRITLIDSTTRR